MIGFEVYVLYIVWTFLRAVGPEISFGRRMSIRCPKYVDFARLLNESNTPQYGVIRFCFCLASIQSGPAVFIRIGPPEYRRFHRGMERF